MKKTAFFTKRKNFRENNVYIGIFSFNASLSYLILSNLLNLFEPNGLVKLQIGLIKVQKGPYYKKKVRI